MALAYSTINEFETSDLYEQYLGKCSDQILCLQTQTEFWSFKLYFLFFHQIAIEGQQKGIQHTTIDIVYGY